MSLPSSATWSALALVSGAPTRFCGSPSPLEFELQSELEIAHRI